MPSTSLACPTAARSLRPGGSVLPGPPELGDAHIARVGPGSQGTTRPTATTALPLWSPATQEAPDGRVLHSPSEGSWPNSARVPTLPEAKHTPAPSRKGRGAPTMDYSSSYLNQQFIGSPSTHVVMQAHLVAT